MTTLMKSCGGFPLVNKPSYRAPAAPGLLHIPPQTLLICWRLAQLGVALIISTPMSNVPRESWRVSVARHVIPERISYQIARNQKWRSSTRNSAGCPRWRTPRSSLARCLLSHRVFSRSTRFCSHHSYKWGFESFHSIYLQSTSIPRNRAA